MIKKDNRKTTNNNKRQAQFIRDLQELANKNNHNKIKIYSSKTAVVFEHLDAPVMYEDTQVLSLFTDKANFEMSNDYIVKYYKQSLTRLGQKLKKYTDEFRDVLDEALYNFVKDLNYTYLDLDSLTINDLNYKTYEATVYVSNNQCKADEYTFNFKPYFEAYVDNNNEDFTDFFEKENCIKELCSAVYAEDTYSVIGLNSIFSLKIISDLGKTKIIKEINYPDFSNYDKISIVDYTGIEEMKETVVNKPFNTVINEFREDFSDFYYLYEPMLEYYDTLKADLIDLMGNPDNKYLAYLKEKTGEDFTVSFLSKEAVKNHNVFGEDGTLGIEILPNNCLFALKSKSHNITLDPDNFHRNRNLWETIQAITF